MQGSQHRPTKKTREGVCIMLASGCTHEIIAAVVGIDDDTLRKHYAHELEHGKGIAVAKLAGSLYARGIRGDTTAAIFWLKTRAQWREMAPAQDDKRLTDFTRDELRAAIARYVRTHDRDGAEERSSRTAVAVR